MNLPSLYSLVSGLLSLTLSSCIGESGVIKLLSLDNPDALVVTQTGSNSARLNWRDNCSEESCYYVFQSKGTIVLPLEPLATLPANSQSYEFNGLEPNSDYFLGVQAAVEKDNRLSDLIFAAVYRTPHPEDPPTEEDPDPNPIDAISFNWTEVPSDGLPAAIKIYKTDEPLSGRPFNAWYAIADPKEVNVRVLYPGGGNKATIDQQAEGEGNCLVLINGGIFGSAPIGFALLDGVQTPWRLVEEDNWAVDKQYWGPDGKLHTVSRGLFGVDRSGKPGVFWSFTPSSGTVRVYEKPIPTVAGGAVQKEADDTFPCAPANWQPYNALTCGPVLLQNGRCPITDKKTSKGYWETNYELWADDIYGVKQLADRTAVGYTPEGKVILFICDGRIDASKGATTLEMAAIMKGLGCEGALNLDGGGSTGMWIAGKGHINDLTGGDRPVMTTVGFFSK